MGASAAMYTAPIFNAQRKLIMTDKYVPTGIIKEWLDMLEQGKEPSEV
jgi:hypothetical protein